MAETEIVLVMPDSAAPGARIEVGIIIRNIGWEVIHAVPGFCRVDGEEFPPFYMEDMVWLDRYSSWTWYRYFYMPNRDITVYAESWWENSKILHRDAIAMRTITPEVTTEVTGFTISDYVKV